MPGDVHCGQHHEKHEPVIDAPNQGAPAFTHSSRFRLNISTARRAYFPFGSSPFLGFLSDSMYLSFELAAGTKDHGSAWRNHDFLACTAVLFWGAAALCHHEVAL